jgi:hypothetical protein
MKHAVAEASYDHQREQQPIVANSIDQADPQTEQASR